MKDVVEVYQVRCFWSIQAIWMIYDVGGLRCGWFTMWLIYDLNLIYVVTTRMTNVMSADLHNAIRWGGISHFPFIENLHMKVYRNLVRGLMWGARPRCGCCWKKSEIICGLPILPVWYGKFPCGDFIQFSTSIHVDVHPGLIWKFIKTWCWT